MSGLFGIITQTPKLGGDDGKTIMGYDYEINNPTNFLQRELGIMLELKQEESIVKAIAKPDEFIASRKEAVDKASENAAKQTSAYLSNLLEAGIPSEKARIAALEHGRNLYNAEMAIFNLQNPGYSKAIGAHEASRANDENVRDLYLTKEAKRAYKQKWLAKHKAKESK